MIRMKSKLHGFCHAHDGNEEAYLRKLGWVEESEQFDGEAASAPVSEPAAQVAAVVTAPAKPRKAKA